MLPTAAEARAQAERQARAAKAETETERTGILLGVPDKVIREAKNVAKALGADVRFYRRKRGGRVKQDLGYYDHNTGIIYLNADIRNPASVILGHEMIHHIQLTRGYLKFADTVLKKIQQDGGSLSEMRQELKERYAENGVELTSLAKIDQEVIAEYAQAHLFTDEASITSVVNADKESGNVIRRFLDNVLAKLGNTNARERVFVARARSLYAKALQENESVQEQFKWKDTVREEREKMRTARPAETKEQMGDNPSGASHHLPLHKGGLEDGADAVPHRGGIESERDAAEYGDLTEEEYDTRMDVLDAEASMAGESMLYEDGRQYSIAKEKGVAKRSKKRYNKKQIRMNSQEHTLVKSAIMKKESGRTDGDVPTVDSVYAYDKYYLYEPAPGYDGVVFARFDPVTEQDKINKIERWIQDGGIRDNGYFNRRFSGSRLRKRNNSLHNVHDEDGRAGRASGRVSVSKLGSDSVGHSGGGIRNQSGVGLETETEDIYSERQHRRDRIRAFA